MAFNDWNGDGKKDIFDDMIEYQIYKETMGESDDDFSYRRQRKRHKAENPQFITTVFSDDSKKDYSNPPSSGATILASLIVCVLCFGAIALCVASDIGSFGMALLLFGAVGLSVLVLRGFGVMR
ncbi:MAG: hypothetical protein E7571_00790 [Ruminococcaceae bacterium]|nr:hypothetical protein [Oscillospiraceae bacterium]